MEWPEMPKCQNCQKPPKTTQKGWFSVVFGVFGHRDPNLGEIKPEMPVLAVFAENQ